MQISSLLMILVKLWFWRKSLTYVFHVNLSKVLLFYIWNNLLFYQVLRTLVLSPLGTQLSNDSICEIMLSCFKICFETRLNGECRTWKCQVVLYSLLMLNYFFPPDLLRHSAESCLRDIVQFLFTRLPLFIQTPADSHFGQNKVSGNWWTRIFVR